MADPSTLAAAGLVFALASGLQSAVGFGIGLVAIPLLLTLGVELPQAVAMLVGAATIQTGWGAWHLRQHLQPALSLRVAVGQWLAVPLGVAAMAWLSAAGPSVVKRAVAVAIVLALLVRWLARPAPRASVPSVWGVLCGAVAGLLSGGVGMGGPPIVLFALAHDWPPDRFRVFLWSQLLLGVPALIGALTWRFGSQVPISYALGLAFAPVIWAGGWLGLRLAATWDTRTLQRAATALLLALAAMAALG